uniref:Uncharacterized protein n=1 Tax=Aegilops tauschii subsp. strangulata TaxID=200361 RepID=A0A453JJ25_AEGTS
MVRIRASDSSFKITSVYGPTDSASKDAFFAELLSQKPPPGVAWLATGDFHQIYRARDKNKRNVNRSRINRFRAALQSCELKEIHLQNRTGVSPGAMRGQIPPFANLTPSSATPSGTPPSTPMCCMPCRHPSPTTALSCLLMTKDPKDLGLSSLKISGPPFQDSMTLSKRHGPRACHTRSLISYCITSSRR